MIENVNANTVQTVDSQNQVTIQWMREHGLINNLNLPTQGPNGTQFTPEEDEVAIAYIAGLEQSATGDTLKQLQAVQAVWVEMSNNGDKTPPSNTFYKMPKTEDNLPVLGHQYTESEKLAALIYLAGEEQSATGSTLTKLQAESAAWQNLPTHQ